MATPVINPLPAAPTRADGATDFSAKADAMIAALPPMVVQLNSSFAWQAGVLADTQAARDAAGVSAAAAAASANTATQQAALATTNGQAQVSLAATARQGAESARDQAQVYASAASAAAGLPALAGNKYKALVVKADESGVEYKPIGQAVGDILTSAIAPSANYLPANGGIYLQSSYPVLFSKLGTSTNIELSQMKSGTLGGSVATFSVAYGLGKFVIAVADSVIYTSSDGQTWTAKTGLPNNLRAAVFVNNRLMVFANSSTAFIYSTNGVDWITGTLPSASSIYSAAYGNGTYVAVGTSAVFTSTDGVNWVARTPAFSSTIYSVIYAFGMFIAVDAGGSARYMTSPDGVTWTQRTLPAYPSGRYNMANINGVLAVSCQNPTAAQSISSAIMRTVDGINWTLQKLPVPAVWSGLSIAAGKFLIYAINQSAVATSKDGVSWQLSASGIADASTTVYSRAVQSAASPNAVVVAQEAANYIYHPIYAYDPLTQFAMPVVDSPVGLKSYIKCQE